MPARPDHDLLTIHQDLSEIQLTWCRGTPQTTGCVNGILHAGALRQTDQARPAHRSQDMHHKTVLSRRAC